MKKILSVFIISILFLTSCSSAEPSLYDISNSDVNILSQSKFPEVKTISDTENKQLVDFPTESKEAKILFESGSKIHSSILINEGILFFGNEECDFYAIDIQSKTKKWQYKTDDKVETLPVYTDGKVIFNAGNSMYILNADSGKEVGKVTHTSDKTMRLSNDRFAFNDTQVAVADGVAYYIALNGDLVAVDISACKEIWSVKTKADGASDTGLNYYNGKLYWCDSLKKFNCFDISKKEIIYQIEFSERIFAPMLINEGKIYVAGRNYIMSCINAESGEILWRSYSSDSTSWFSGGSVCNGNTLYSCTSDEHTLVSYEKNTGEFKRIYPTETNAYTLPVVYGENIVIVATDVYSLRKSYVMEFDTNSHTKKWKATLSEGLLSSPAVYDGSVFFGSDSGRIYYIKCS